MPRAIRSEGLEALPSATPRPSPHFYSLPNVLLQISLSTQPAQTVKKDVSALSALDLLAESLTSPDIAEVILLNKGVMLNLRYIHKLNELVQAGGKSLTVAVIEPSRLTRFFCSA